jgi:acetyltransferase-like isoleucine patch superfamily enzyme
LSGSVPAGDNSLASLIQKIAYRVYRFLMPYEALPVLRIRRSLIRLMTGRTHQNLNIFAHVFIDGYDQMKIGRDVSINRGCHLDCAGGLTIGDYVAIGHSTTIITFDHGFASPDTPIKYQPVTYAPVTIGSNVWVGAKVTILAGVRIADGTIVAAGAVVTRTITEPNMIVAGVPAKPIKSRFS